MAVTLKINGAERRVDVDTDTPLLWVLREQLALTGTKYGCGLAQCGACTVHVDGVPTRACVTPVGDLANASVVTIEGIGGRIAEAVREAWVKLDVPQCGYCQSGQVMAAVALLNDTRNPNDGDIDAAMAGNLCRCATYHRIRAAVHEAAKTLGG